LRALREIIAHKLPRKFPSAPMHGTCTVGTAVPRLFPFAPSHWHARHAHGTAKNLCPSKPSPKLWTAWGSGFSFRELRLSAQGLIPGDFNEIFISNKFLNTHSLILGTF
jgi:hypothetical protein